jgi:hypothetical protein
MSNLANAILFLTLTMNPNGSAIFVGDNILTTHHDGGAITYSIKDKFDVTTVGNQLIVVNDGPILSDKNQKALKDRNVLMIEGLTPKPIIIKTGITGEHIFKTPPPGKKIQFKYID